MSETNSWLKRFHHMVAELREHPRVAITNLWIGEPITEEELESIEQELGFTLDEELKNLYRQANGVQLLWMDRESEDFDEDGYEGIDTRHNSYLCGDWDQATGIINIIPLRDSLLDEEGMNEFLNEGNTFDEPAHPFDMFSFFNTAVLYLNPQTPGTILRIGDDHDATFDDSNEINLSTYLESILRHRGMVDPRRGEFFSDKGYYREFSDLVIPADQPRPPIDDILL